MFNKIAKTSKQIVLFFECTFTKGLEKLKESNSVNISCYTQPRDTDIYSINFILDNNFLVIPQRTPYQITSNLISRLGILEQSKLLFNCCFDSETRLSEGT